MPLPRYTLWSNVAQYTAPQPTSPQFISDLYRCYGLGITGVRIDCVPGYTNMGKNLADPLAKVHAARALGLHVNLMCPHWEASKAQVADYAGLGAFAGRVVAAFDGLVQTYELGNEYNSRDFTGGATPDPAFQANVTKAFLDGGFGACRQKILTGGIAPVFGTGYVRMDTWTDAYWPLLRAADRTRIDGYSVHLYSVPDVDDSAYTKSWGTLDSIVATTGKKLYVTELNVIGSNDPATDVTAQLDALVARGDVRRIFLYEMSNQNDELGYGCFDAEGNATAVLTAVENWQGKSL